jgi:hypothetical protein
MLVKVKKAFPNRGNQMKANQTSTFESNRVNDILKKYFTLIFAICALFMPLANVMAQATTEPKKETVAEAADKDPLKQIVPEGYKSPMKGNIHPEFLRSMFLTSEQMGAVKKTNSFWIDNMKVGVYLRPRYESKQNFDFNKTTDDYTNYAAQTSQIWFLVDPSPYFAIKVTIQDSRVWGGSQTPTGGDNRYALTTSAGYSYTGTPVTVKNNTDIREAFIMLKKTDALPLNIQIGRQVFAYGDLKVLGPLNWLYNGFAFDGVRFMYDSKYFSSHLFGTVLSEQHSAPGGTITANGRTNGTIDDAYFTGTYNTIKPFDLFHIDLYGFGVHKKWILNNNPLTTQDRSRQRDNLITGGIRITNRTANNNLPKGQIWDWTLESAWQTGYNGQRVNASWDILEQSWDGKRIHTERVKYDSRFFSGETGITVLDNLRLGVGYTYASGDPNRSDSKVGTWNPLFPQIAGSLPYWNIMNGQSTIVGFQNTKAYSFRVNYKTEKWGTFIFTTYDILKAKGQDAWYNVGGTAVSDGSSENFSNDYTKRDRLGKRLFYQYDFTWIYNYAESISIWSGASYIQAQDAVRNARENPNSTDITKRYTFDGKALYFYLMVSAAL